MVGRTCCRSERLHLLHEEGNESLGIEQGLGFLIEIGLVGRAAAFCHEEEFVFVAVHCIEVDLCRKVAAGVHLVIHVQGSILRVAQVAAGIGVIYTVRELLFVVAASVNVLAFLADYDCRTGVLAEGKLSL